MMVENQHKDLMYVWNLEINWAVILSGMFEIWS